MACLSVQNFLFWGHKADCAVMDKVHCKAGGLCWKIVKLVDLCPCFSKYETYSADNYWLTLVLYNPLFTNLSTTGHLRGRTWLKQLGSSCFDFKAVDVVMWWTEWHGNFPWRSPVFFSVCIIPYILHNHILFICYRTALTLRRLMSYIYIWSTHSWCF